MHPLPPPTAAPRVLHFIRHGATAVNAAQLRCGGDIDPPLTDTGRDQVRRAALQVARWSPAVRVLVSSDLARTLETARVVADALPHPVKLVVEPGLRERRLGEWNLQPIAATQAALQAGQTPPGGESEAEFRRRIAQALARVAPLAAQPVLVVGSKGVARMLGLLTGSGPAQPLGNAVLTCFELDPAMGDLMDGQAAKECCDEC